MKLFGYTLIKADERFRLLALEAQCKAFKVEREYHLAELDRLREIEREFERWSDRDERGRFVKTEGVKADD